MTPPVTPPAAHQGANDSARPKAKGPALRRKPGSPEEDAAAGEALPVEGAAEAAPPAEGRAPGDDLEKAAPLAALEGGSAAVAQGSSWMGSIWTWFGVTGAGAAISAFASGKGGSAPAATAAAPVASDLALSGSEDAAAITGQVGATDANGDALSYSIVGSTPAGLSFNSDGAFAYVPQAADDALDSGETRTVTFLYVARDGSTSSNTATVTLTIQGANDAPVTEGPRTVSGSGSGPVSGTVVATDSEGGALSYAVSGTTPPGLVFNADGSFTYTPQPEDLALDDGEARSISFDYVAYDGTAYSTPTTVTLVINGVNDAPVASSDPVTGAADATITGSVSGTDVDVESLSYRVIGTPPAGLVFNADGTFSYAPQPADIALDDGEQNTVTFQFVANDGTADSAPATVTIVVNGVNDAPVATAGAEAGSAAAAAIDGAVSASDVDVEGITYAVTGPTPSGLTFNPDGTFSYAPQAADYALDDGEQNVITFQYVASDGTASSAPATVTITVSGANDAPLSGGAAAVTGTEDDAAITGSVPAASDVDGEALTYALTAAAPAGLIFNADGTFSYTPQAMDNALDSGETRTVTFDYIANDGTVNSAPATVTLTITGANDAPVSGGAASASGSEDAAGISGSVPTASDVDGEALTYALTAAAPAGVVFNSDGTFTVTPQAADQGLDAGESRTITFSYVANDGTANSAPATATVTITGVNDAPVSGGAASASGSEDAASITGSVPAAGDVDMETLTYTLVGTAPAGVTFNSNGTFSVTPQASDQGLDSGETRTITFDYVANDGTSSSAAATVTVTINGLNDAPVSGGAASASGSEDAASISGSVPAASDVDGESLTYSLVGSAPAGLTLNSDGSFSYTPQAADAALADGATRTVTFDYQASDGSLVSNTATATITVAGVNDAPVIGLGAATPLPVAPNLIGGEFHVNTTTADHQQVSPVAALAGGGFVVAWQSQSQDGSYWGIYAQRYDAAGVVQGGEFRVNTTTASHQDTPSVAGLADGGFVVTWVSNAQDGDAEGVYGQRYDASGAAQGSEFRINTTTAGQQLKAASIALEDGGFLVAWMSSDGGNFGIYARRYDASGVAQGDEFRVNALTADNQNIPAATVLADGSLVIAWTTELPDGSSTVLARRVSATGTVQGSDFLIGTGSDVRVAGLADGSFMAVWTGNDGSGAAGIYARHYSSAGTALGAAALVNSTTLDVQTSPAISALQDGGYLVTWTSYGQDGSTYGIYAQRYDADGMRLGGEFRVNTTTAYSQMAPYIAALANGDLVVTWTSSHEDTAGVRSNGIYAQRLRADGTPGDAGALTEGAATTAVSGQLLASDVDTGDAATWSITNASAYGAMSIDATGRWTFTLDNNAVATQALAAGQVVTQTLTATVTDAAGATDNRLITITLTGSNDAPVVGAVAVSGSEDAAGITGSVSGSDAEGSVLTYALASAAPAGLVFNADGTFTYTPQAADQALRDGQNRTVTFDYAANDGAATSAPATVTLTVEGANDAPLISLAAPILNPVQREGLEFRVNTYTSLAQQAQSIAVLADGGFIATWMSDGQDGSGVGIYAARFDAQGTPVGGEFRVNTTVTNAQSHPEAIGLADGSYLVTWTSNPTGTNSDIYAQRYDAAGAKVGSEFRVNTYTSNAQEFSDVDLASDGSLVIVWHSLQQDSSLHGIYAQRYDSSGAASGSEFRVNTTTANEQWYPCLATLPGGGFVIVWGAARGDGVDMGAGIFAQRYDASGTPAGGEFLVNATTAGEQIRPAITALSDGGFVVTWDSYGQDGEYNGIYGQRHASNGALIGGEFRINTTAAGDQTESAIAALDDGGFIVVWVNGGMTGDTHDIVLQRFGANGLPVGGEVAVNTYTTNYQSLPTITALPGGDFIVSWVSDGQDGSGYGVYAQRFHADGSVADAGSLTEGSLPSSVSNQLLVIDADSGDTATWSITNDSAYGSMSIDATGRWTFALDNNAAATQALAQGQVVTETFTATVTDGAGASDTQLVTIAITGSNDAPVASAVSISGNEDAASITGSVSASDAEGSALTYSLVGSTPAGLVFNTDGTFSYAPLAPDQALRAGQSRAVTFSYKANDGSVDSNTATATITVAGANDAPVIVAPLPRVTPVAIGTEFRVNTTTSGDQSVSGVAALAGGGFVVTWTSTGQDGSGNGVYGQRYAADGTAVGAEFRINTTTSNDQSDPRVIALANGGFVVAWGSAGQDGSGWGAYGQRYAADGSAVGAEFRISTATANDQRYPVLTLLNDGGFVAAWRSDGQDGSYTGIYGQRYAADGTTVGAEFRINTTTINHQEYPAVTALADGGFVVTWSSMRYDGSNYHYDVCGQRYAANGTAVGAEFQINTAASGNEYGAAVAALADGGFVVTWQVRDLSFGPMDVFGQRYTADGTPVGTEFRINSFTGDTQFSPSVVGLEDGGFLVTWISNLQDGSGFGIYGRRYAADGAAVGAEFRINTTTAGDQLGAPTAALLDGTVVVTWHSYNQDGSGAGVYAQRLSLGDRPDTGRITEDDVVNVVSAQLTATDIDSGDSIAWSITNDSPYGTMAIAADGTWTFVLDNNAAATQVLAEGQVVTQTFTATAADSHGASDTHAVTVIITGNNDAPVAVADTDSVTEASAGIPAASGNVLGNDIDTDSGAVLTVTAVNGAGANVGAVLNGTYGTLTLNANGTYTYTLDNTLATTQALSAGQSVSEVFSYTITDDKGATSGSTLTVTVNGANDAPSVYLADTVVNTTTANDQQKPAVAALKDGGYIVVWQDYVVDASYADLFAQRYDANGNKVGAEFQVNSYTNLSQWDPDVTALTNGGFVITWSSGEQDGDGNGVYARIYDAAGAEQSGEVLVNTHTAHDQWMLDITALANGGFAVTWESYQNFNSAIGGADYDVYFQRFAANGAKVGSETVANSGLTLQPGSIPIDQYKPEIAGLANGNFVMVWESNLQDGSYTGIYGRVYNAAGATTRSEFRLNTTTLDRQYEPSVSALGDGGFVVVWMGAGAEDGVGVYGQRFDASGAAVGTEFHVNTTTAGDQLNPAVTSLAGGGFVVTWQSPDADYTGIFAQCFDAAGAKAGSEFLVNRVTAGTQAYPDVASLADGSFVVTWESYAQDGSGYAIVSQRFLADGTPAALGLVTENGVGTATGRLAASDSDSGDSVAWTITNDSPYGTMAIAADGTWTFTLDNNAEATQALAEGQLVAQTFTATATDSAGASDTRDVTITLIGNNDAPVVVDDSGFVTLTGTALQLSAATLLANDRDAEGDSLTLAAVGNAVGGSVSLSGDTVTFTPNAGFSGNARFSYTLSDGSATATAAVSLTVNTAPVISLGAATALTPEKAGTEFRVNTFTSNSQRSPAMTTLAGGDFVVSWVSNLQDGSGSGIYAQRYNAAGTAVGSEFRINSTTVDNQDMPALAALPNGGFVAVWQSVSQFNSAWDTYARVYNAAGSAVSEFMVPQQNAYNESTPAVTALPDGNFVVSWRSNIQEYGSPPGIYAIRYAGDAMIGIEFRVDSDINAASGDAREPALTTLADGSYVAVWASGLEGSWDIYAQRFSAATASTGAPGIRIPLGEQFRINTTTADEQRNPAIAALADGGFVVVWESRLQDGSGYGIYAQRFDATGGALGSEFCVNATTADQQRDPAIAALADGGFVVSWETYLQDGSGYGIYAQRYDASGVAAGSEFRVNTTTTDGQVDPALTALANGGFVVSWASNLQDGSGSGVYAQRFEAGSRPANEGLAYEDGGAPADSTLSGQLLASDADTGDTLAWSISDDTPASRYGSITIAADGTWGYTLDNTLAATKALAAGATVTEAFTATVTDSLGATDTQTVTVTIVGTAGDYQAGAEAVNDSLTAGASGDYLDGKSGADALTGGGGSDIFDGGAGDDTLIDTTASDDLYLYREGAGGFDIITESTDASSDTDVLRILDATGVIDFSSVGADLYIQVGSNPAEGLLVKDFFTADQSALNADIEQLNVYSDSGSTLLIGSYTSQQIFEQLFP